MTQESIRTVSVSRHYQMGGSTVKALDSVSLDVQAGEFVALLGSSGSGKSTLLNLLAGLDTPTSGSVIVNGSDLARMTPRQLALYRRLQVGMVFQSFNLVPKMTIAENVELPLRFAQVEREQRAAIVESSLARVGLAGRLHHRPTEISGGEQQRTAIARALVNSPKLLMADEPTGNLDSRTGEQVMNILRDLNRNMQMTIVLVTHERALAQRFADRLIFLSDGRVVQPEAAYSPAEVAQ